MRTLALALAVVSTLAAQTVTLHSVVVNGVQCTVTYSKDFATCAHLKLMNGTLVHSANWFCTQGTNVAVSVALSGFNPLLQLGTQVILCHGNNGSICSAPVTVIVDPQFTVSQPPTISLSAGGIQLMIVNGSSLAAGDTYLIGGSITGTSGFTVGMFFVPLILDSWFDFTAMNPNTPPLSGFQGILDPTGSGFASITVPAGLPPGLAGLTAWHAVAVIRPGVAILGVSGAVSLTLVP